ncbi:MAG TPA: ATP-binding protein [Candidatus Saccharimonadales bacterium]|nr:ATP-binding protein [Candidatus Saccharimonadales bacterium]
MKLSSYKVSLRTRLVGGFLTELIVFFMTGLILLFLQNTSFVQYRSLTINMVDEYHLTDSSYRLISEFNQFSQESSKSLAENDSKQIQATINKIHSTMKLLDSSVLVADPNSENNYIGLKNTINSLISEIQSGIAAYSQGSYNASSYYNQANQLYGFVATDSAQFINSALQRISDVQGHVDEVYKVSIVAGSSLYFLVLMFVVFYALRLSKKIVYPIDKLTSTAEAISAGDMSIAISHNLLSRQDETGRLANAFNIMLNNLKHNINELSLEKKNVEHKVVERTQELNEQRARLISSINSVDAGFILTGPDNEVVLINSVAESILNHELNADGKIIDRQIKHWTTDVINDLLTDDFDFTLRLKEVASKRTAIHINELNYSGRVLTLYIAPINDSKHSQEYHGAVVMIEDVTEAKILERSREEFFSIASHELRTPLTAIRGNTSMILDYFGDQLKDNNVEEMIRDIYQSSLRLIEIVNDFLDVSRLEQGKMVYHLEAFEVSPLIESVIHEVATLGKDKGVEILFAQEVDPPMIYADKNATKQIIYNLIGNALKFTEKGSITIKLENASDSLKVLFSDTGRGMSPEAQQLLFHKFQQTGSSLLTRDTTRGTGLGLYISKLLVEQMNGQIKLESSAEGKGTTFSFTLPLASNNT